MFRRVLRNACVACAAGLLGVFSPAVRGADHRDSPDIIVDAAADLLDVYAFVNPNKTDHLILALTVNPAQLPGLPAVSFENDVLYQFKIDNDGDFVEDVVIQARFDKATRNQEFIVLGPAEPTNPRGRINRMLKGAPSLRGAANGTTIDRSGTGDGVTRAWAGLADDPFFFDLLFIFRAIGVLPGTNTRLAPGIDFYNNTNISGLVVEVPIAQIKGDGDSINVWSTTSRPMTTRNLGNRVDNRISGPWIQIERTAFPTLNSVLIPADRKEEFNQSVPSKDRRLFRQQVIDSLTALNTDAAYSTTIVDALLIPDVLRLDVTSQADFPNGRKFDDDVIDAVLQAATNTTTATDDVDTNDVAFPADFPFIAPAHAPTQQIDPRD